jgi:hypothetical protein
MPRATELFVGAAAVTSIRRLDYRRWFVVRRDRPAEHRLAPTGSDRKVADLPARDVTQDHLIELIVGYERSRAAGP